MSTAVEPIRQFVECAGTLKGNEKGEARVSCDRLFQAFGHGGYKAAGATLEYRVKGVAEGVPGTPGSSGDTIPNS
jgi:hypothetical protein